MLRPVTTLTYPIVKGTTGKANNPFSGRLATVKVLTVTDELTPMGAHLLVVGPPKGSWILTTSTIYQEEDV